MYGNDEPPSSKKPGKKSKGKQKRREIDEELLSKMPPAYPTTDVSEFFFLDNPSTSWHICIPDLQVCAFFYVFVI